MKRLLTLVLLTAGLTLAQAQTDVGGMSGRAAGGGTGDALTTNPLSQFAPTTSAQLAGVISNETGTGLFVLATDPALAGTPTAPTAAAGTNTTQIATTAHVFAHGGYTMEGGLFALQTLVDATTFYVGYVEVGNAAAHTTLASAQMIVPKSGTITRVHFSTMIGTNGSNEAVTHRLFINGADSTVLSAAETYDPGANTAKAFIYTGLSTAVTAGDTLALKVVGPTWATNPTITNAHLLIWIE